jgi:hypothetical protein
MTALMMLMPKWHAASLALLAEYLEEIYTLEQVQYGWTM